MQLTEGGDDEMSVSDTRDCYALIVQMKARAEGGRGRGTPWMGGGGRTQRNEARMERIKHGDGDGGGR